MELFEAIDQEQKISGALLELSNLRNAASSSYHWNLNARRAEAIRTLCGLLLRAFDGELTATDKVGIARWKAKIGEEGLRLWRDGVREDNGEAWDQPEQYEATEQEVLDALFSWSNLRYAADYSFHWNLSKQRAKMIKVLCGLLLRAFDGRLTEADQRGIARWREGMGEGLLSKW